MKNKFLASIADMLVIFIFVIGVISFFYFHVKIEIYTLSLLYLIGYHFWILKDIPLKARFQVYFPSYKMWREIGGSQSLKEEFSILEKKWLYIFPKKNEIVQNEKVDIAYFILSSREHACMTQKHLADASGVSVRTIQRAESSGKIGYESLRCICAALNIDAPHISQEEIEPVSLFVSIGSVFEWGLIFIAILEWNVSYTGYSIIISTLITYWSIAKLRLRKRIILVTAITLPLFGYLIYINHDISLLKNQELSFHRHIDITIDQLKQYIVLVIGISVCVASSLHIFLRDYRSRKIFLFSLCVSSLLFIPIYKMGLIQQSIQDRKDTIISDVMPEVENMSNITKILSTTDIPEDKKLCIKEISIASFELSDLHTQYLKKKDYKLMYDDFEHDILGLKERTNRIYKKNENKENDYLQSLNKDNIKPFLDKCFNNFQ